MAREDGDACVHILHTFVPSLRGPGRGLGQLRMMLPMMPPTAPAAALLVVLSPETCWAM